MSALIHKLLKCRCMHLQITSDNDGGSTCNGGMGGGGGMEGDKVRAHASFCTQPHTVDPQFNEVPRDWENLLVISRAHYIENLHFTNFWQNKQNVHYIEVWLMSNFQHPAFPDLNNFCNKQ